MKKRLLSILLCLVMVVGLLPVSALAKEAEPANLFPYQYQGENGDMAEKVSHRLVAPNSKYEGSRRNDGLVDYDGDGVLSANIGNADDSGCRGQSYSWSAMAYGDWIYTGLLYNALGNTVQLMDSGLGHKYDPELLPAILNVIFNGDFFTQEEDGKTSSGALVKLNVKTGEVKILLSSSSEGDAKHDVSFRNAVEYHGKFYFCGTVDHAPQIWQVDPKTDECKKVYGMDTMEFYEGFQQGISAGIRGMCVYNNDELIVSSVAKNAKGEFEAQIYSTKTPDDPESFKVIATQEQLFNYPAFHFSDSIYGGSIWEIVEFNNKLYVSICTGTPQNMPTETTMQSFALVCGEKQSDGSWNWRPVAGDQNKDKARYTFGIDPERTCSGAGVLTVLGDHLYIGEYNDEEIALIQIMFNLDFGFMNENLKQSVNLYRMDKDENIELIVGDKTDMFPEGGISGIGSGFGHNENQYIWRMTVHNDKLYCGTFDTSSLLEPVGQFVNGDLALWEPVQWNRLFNYIRELLKLTQDKYGTMPIDEMSSEAQIREDIRELFAFFDSTSLATISDDDTVLPGAGIDAEYDLLADLFGSLPASCFEDGTHADAAIIEALSETFAEDDDAAFYDRIDNDLNGADDVLDDMGVYPDYVDDLESNLEAMQKLAASMKELIQLVKKIVVTAQYMSVAERGCDVYVTEDGVNFETITIDGFGDPFNHGLRVYAETDNGLAFGTANPFYGTQWWLIREDNKPVEVVPKAPVATEIPTAYIVSCVTENSNHGAAQMNLIADTFTIGEVAKDGDNYVCPITIATAKYAEAYSVENGKHTAKEASITFNMTWDGKEWKAPEMTQLPVIKVECKATKPEAPKAPAEAALPSAYFVSCTTDKAHVGTWMSIPGADKIGEVTKDGETYICPITVSTKEYAEEYSAATVINKPHTALKESITFNMTWDGQKWVAPNPADLPVIELKCEATKPDPKPDPKPETFTVTVVGSEAAITGAGKYEAGKLVTIDAGMRLGYTFAGWTTQNGVTLANPYSSSTTFTMPAYNVTVTANWRLTPIVPTPSTPSVSNLYPIEILDTTNGAVTSSHKYASAGTTVTLTVNPAAGYTLGSLTAYTSNKVDLKLTDKGEGKYTFTMPASKVFVASVFNPVNGRFVDVPSGSYFEEAVNWAVANGITTGTSATTFDPDGICTRAQAVTFLWRAAGSPAPANSATPFTDVAADSYYAQAVAWAVENGITKGTSDTTFSPDAHCGRAQIVTFLWRAQKSPVVTAANPFADVSVDAYYVNAIQWAVSEGVTTGTSAVTFSPDADCTRAQIVTFIWRALGK